MKKYLISLIMLFFAGVYLVSQQNPNLYNEIKSAVVYIQHEIYMDPELCENRELVEELEKKSDEPILGEYITLSSGSGFFVDESGIFLTNRHVVQMKNITSLRNRLAAVFTSNIKEKYGDDFESEELDRIVDDLVNMIRKGKYRFTVSTGEEVYENISFLCISEDEDTDIALGTVNPDKKVQCLRLAFSEDVKDLVGINTLSFGYPIGSVLDQMFEDRVVTMNKGAVSAIHDSELNIQHSAAISKGNSGGPLTDESGIVLGMNTASLDKQGNSLFYAIGSEHIIFFLRENGFNELLKWNRRIPAPVSSNPSGIKFNMLGEIETSADLIVDTEKEASVFIDDVLVGTAPLYIALEKDTAEIRVTGKNGEFSGVLRVLRSVAGTTTLNPGLSKLKAFISFIGDNGAVVFADDRFIGTIPFTAEFSAGDYTFESKKEGFFYKPISFKVESGMQELLSINGEKAYELKLDGLPAEETPELIDFIRGREFSLKDYQYEILLKNGDIELQFEPDEHIYLSPGEWKLSISGSLEYHGMTLPVRISDKDLVMNLNNYRPVGELEVRNFPGDCQLLVDGKPVEIGEEAVLELPLGAHDVFIWKDDFRPLDVDITVRPENNAYITWPGYAGHDASAGAFTVASILTTGVGTALFVAGQILSTNEFSVGNSSSYSEYKLYRTFGTVGNISGVIIGATGILLLIPAFIEFGLLQEDLDRFNEIKGGK